MPHNLFLVPSFAQGGENHEYDHERFNRPRHYIEITLTKVARMINPS